MLLKTSTHLQNKCSEGLIYQAEEESSQLQQFQTMPYRSDIFTPSQQKQGHVRNPK